ncbi:hypothetical protein [Nocardia cyriacigeorgica]|uniref:hypothetical protein n=1 Tax=Nocardia cyriacigeorgica TaxID=135487 RepID=UPI002456DA74|nr:hypothetical protein [Nocardia cyriacigeorgica]
MSAIHRPRHDALLLDDAEPRFDLDEPRPVGRDPLFQFGPAQDEHAAQLRAVHLPVEDSAHLFQREPEILHATMRFNRAS